MREYHTMNSNDDMLEIAGENGATHYLHWSTILSIVDRSGDRPLGCISAVHTNNGLVFLSHDTAFSLNARRNRLLKQASGMNIPIRDQHPATPQQGEQTP